MFKPGESGNPSGRPKGSLNKDRTNYLDLQIWAKMVMEGATQVSPEKQAQIGIQLLALLLPKVNNLPTDPEESVAIANDRFERIKELQKIGKPSELPEHSA